MKEFYHDTIETDDESIRKSWKREKNVAVFEVIHDSLGSGFIMDFNICERKLIFRDSAIRWSHQGTIKEISIEERFKTLSDRWKAETAGYSTTIHRIANSNYQEIIKMGAGVIPLIVRDLINSTLWFPALRELTGENPVSKEDMGNTKRMREVWLEWAEKKGLI